MKTRQRGKNFNKSLNQRASTERKSALEKGVEESDGQEEKDRSRMRLKMPLMSCFSEIESRRSVNEEEISNEEG